MRYIVSGRLREPCLLSPAEYFTLAVREWEIVLGWLERGTALAYGRLGTPRGGAILLDAGSEAEARRLAGTLPFAPYTDVVIWRSDSEAISRGVAEVILA